MRVIAGGMKLSERAQRRLAMRVCGRLVCTLHVPDNFNSIADVIVNNIFIINFTYIC